MNYKILFLLTFVILLAVGCSSDEASLGVAEDDVVLVEVDGEPISLPMLEFMMENRGISEEDHEAMRGLLDELIRLRVVATAAKEEGLADQPKLRAQRAIRDMEALQIAYFTDIYERYPVTEEQIQETYERQIERSGSKQYRLNTVQFAGQNEALLAIVEISENAAGLEGLQMEQTQTPWVDRSQLPERLRAELDVAEVGQILSLPIPAPEGQGWLVAQIADTRPLNAPPLSDVREGITRTLVRQRLEALVDDLYADAQIVPMLEMEPAKGPTPPAN